MLRLNFLSSGGTLLSMFLGGFGGGGGGVPKEKVPIESENTRYTNTPC